MDGAAREKRNWDYSHHSLQGLSKRYGTKAGEDTAYMQQHTAMREAGISAPDPRNMVLEAVSDLLATWGQRGYHPLVMIDANADWEEREFSKFTRQYGLIDIISDSNDGEAPSSYARGHRRIDYILGDQFVRRATTHSGALALHDGISSSDHTMQFVDFDEQLLFGDDSFTPTPGTIREFRLYDIRRKQHFQDKLEEIYKHQRIPERVNELADRYEDLQILTPEDIMEYQKLDREIESAIKAAASASGRKDFGYQRSGPLCAAGANVRLHKCILSCVRLNIPYTDKVIELAEHLNYKLRPREEITYKEARIKSNEAWRAKRQVEINDDEIRANWLSELAEEKAKENDGDAEKILKQMVKAARARGVFKRLRSILKPEWSQLDYIEVPNEKWFLTADKEELYEFDNGIFLSHKRVDENLYESFAMIKVIPKDICAVEVTQSGDMITVDNPDSIAPCTWRKITKPVEIEAWLLRRNKRHLQQMFVEGSPPTTDAFAPILEEYGTSEVAKRVLDGTYDSSELNLGPEMELFLNALKMTPEERALKVPGLMPTKDFQDVLKVQDENTSSSPSGLHYTLWKAIGEKEKLAAVHAKWVSLPFMYGFVCDRWKKEIDCMIEKKHGVRQIHQLRIIGLMEGDLIARLKWYYNKHLMPNAETIGLSPNQWGGRSGRSAIECAYRKIITWEYFRYAKEVAASFPGDLQSNFDRMLAPLNSLISRKKGLPWIACKCRAALVTAFERPVKTAAGVSKEVYRYEEGDIKLGGEVQGKPDNMQLWTMTSSILLDIHQANCAGISMVDVTKTLASRRTADAYVDDADPLAAAPETNRAEKQWKISQRVHNYGPAS